MGLRSPENDFWVFFFYLFTWDFFKNGALFTTRVAFDSSAAFDPVVDLLPIKCADARCPYMCMCMVCSWFSMSDVDAVSGHAFYMLHSSATAVQGSRIRVRMYVYAGCVHQAVVR